MAKTIGAGDLFAMGGIAGGKTATRVGDKALAVKYLNMIEEPMHRVENPKIRYEFNELKTLVATL